MTASRREFMQLGLAVTGLAIVSERSFKEHLALSPPFPKDLLYDKRLPLSLEFVHAFGSLKRSVWPVGDSVFDTWRSWLVPAWSSSSMPLCGLTGLDVMHTLEELALRQGRAVIFRGEHRWMSDGRIVHHLTGSEAVLRHAGQLTSATWVTGLADLVWQHPSNIDTIATTHLSGAAGKWLPSPENLVFSWIIAPSPCRIPSLWWR